MLSRYCLAEHDATALRRPLVESGSLPALFMHTYDSTLAYPRDLIGYGRNPPHAQWPGRARIAVQFVLNYDCLLYTSPSPRD